MNTESKRRLRVWWTVNPPREGERYPVKDIEEAVKKINELSQRDLKNSKVEMNAQGLLIEGVHFPFDEWEEWHDEDGFDIIQVMDGESEIYDENGKRREMKSETLCPRWGKCKAKKKCPLEKEIKTTDLKVYVRGPCANKDVKVISFFEEWDKTIKET